MFGLGVQELLVILLIAFLFFGGKKLPEIGAGLGKGMRAFKKGLSDLDSEVNPEKPLDEISNGPADKKDKKAL